MLTSLQRRVAGIFFSLPESEGFVLAGGAAAVVRGDVPRTTHDLDLFSDVRGVVNPAADRLVERLRTDGLDCVVDRAVADFVRLVVSDKSGERLEVDLGWDLRWRDVESSEVGPVLSSEELAVDKLLALIGRAEPRDFVDVYFLARKHGIESILRWAPEKDAGFDPYFLAESLGRMERLPRDRFEVDDPTLDELREFYADLRADLLRRTLDPPEEGGDDPGRAAG